MGENYDNSSYGNPDQDYFSEADNGSISGGAAGSPSWLSSWKSSLSDLTGTVGMLAGTAGQIQGAFNGSSQAPSAPTKSPTTATQADHATVAASNMAIPPYLIPIAVGIMAVIGIILFMRKS